MDGHTSHINISVSDFCRNHGIILYCFPAHGSHVLQPLDVSVFGPLKKAWNQSIERYKSEYNIAVTKNRFIQVFNPAWKSATESPQSVVSGFRSTGLVPYNPNGVNYTKLIDPSTIETWKAKTEKNSASLQEKLGLTRAFLAAQNCMSPETLTTFEKCYEDNSNIDENPDRNALWNIYRTLRLMAAGGEDQTEVIVIPENEEPDQQVTLELHLNEETTTLIPIESNETVTTSAACN